MVPVINMSGDQLISSSYDLYRSIIRKNLFSTRAGCTDPYGVVWRNPDNLAYGPLGAIFFATELYRHTADPQVWKDILAALAEMESHCLKNDTRNYSLAFGRSGLAFLFIRLFEITKDDDFLLRAEVIIKKSRVLDTHGIANGNAGIQLCCLLLLKQQPQPWLYEVTQSYLRALLEQAIVTDKDIRWIASAPGAGQDAGWAYGSAASAVVILQAAKLLHSCTLSEVANRALQYEEPWQLPCTGTCAMKNEGMQTAHTCIPYFNSQGLIAGSAGSNLVRLYAAHITGNNAWAQGWAQNAARLQKMIENPRLPAGLYNGLAGIGLAFFNAAAITGNEHYLEVAATAAGQLASRTTADPGLFTGAAGIGYFLLQLVEPHTTDPLFFPDLSSSDLTARKDAFTWVELNRNSLEKQFKHTFPFIQLRYPVAMQQFLEQNSLPSPEQFCRFVQELDKEDLSPPDQEFLHKQLDKDCFILQLKQGRGSGRSIPDELFLSKVEKALSLPVDDFLQLRLQLSLEIDLLYQEEAIDLQQQPTARQLMHLLTGYGFQSWFFRINRFNSVEENALEILRIFVDLFAGEATVETALATLEQLVMSQQPEWQAALMENLGGGNYDALPQMLREKALYCIRAALMTGLLSAVE